MPDLYRASHSTASVARPVLVQGSTLVSRTREPARFDQLSVCGLGAGTCSGLVASGFGGGGGGTSRSMPLAKAIRRRS